MWVKPNDSQLNEQSAIHHRLSRRVPRSPEIRIVRPRFFRVCSEASRVRRHNRRIASRTIKIDERYHRQVEANIRCDSSAVSSRPGTFLWTPLSRDGETSNENPRGIRDSREIEKGTEELAAVSRPVRNILVTMYIYVHAPLATGASASLPARIKRNKLNWTAIFFFFLHPQFRGSNRAPLVPSRGPPFQRLRNAS